MKWAKEKLTTERIRNKLLLATDHKGRTVFHLAEEGNALQILQEIMKWTKEKLTTEEINKLLLATDHKGRTVFHLAEETYKLQILQEMFK
jgi:aminoglycoside N3'-acetyltransferase